MEVTKQDVEKLIELRKANTFLNHLWNVFWRDFTPQGEVRQNEIKVWKQTRWNTSFYPIFTFEFDSDNRLTNINESVNPIAKALIVCFAIGFLYVIIPELADSNLSRNYPITALIAVFVLIVILALRMVYRLEKSIQLQEIMEILGVEVKDKQPKKEWSLKNTLFRLFTYPFCLFLIGLNIFLLLPKGEYLVALGSFGFVGFYLYMDIKMLLKKNRSTSNSSSK